MRMQSSLGCFFFFLICEHVFYFKIYFNPKQVREEKKEAKYNLFRSYVFGKASKSFQIESLFPFHSMQKEKKKPYPKALYKSQK